MNFLAHLYLSGNNPKVMVGNFIGDFVKGKNALQQFDDDIVKGIELHRSIDAFTDTHPVVSRSKDRLRGKYRHYSGVIVDVFYDHFLAANWSMFHAKTLLDFSLACYSTIESFSDGLPNEVNQILPYMKRGNWLLNYAKIEGIHQALSGMARRTPYVSKMEEASFDLRTAYAEFATEFHEFFPELITHCASKLIELNQARE
jgi:acyl carrier protein phosphodiesterase